MSAEAHSPGVDWSFGEEVFEGVPAPPPLPPVGSTFAGHEILGELGAGGMGAVFRARDRAGREVALKVLTLRPTPSEALRLEREGQITASLDHPGIVRVHSAGESEGLAYLVYELVEGRTLRARMESLERDAALTILLGVARALAYAHERGITHRDVKPENILLDADDTPRLADFGLALDINLERLTHSGVMIGTPSAMAPEQVAGQHERYGPPTDVWALGVLLYRLLTHTEPFHGPSLTELVVQIMAGKIQRPRELDPTISPALEALCLKALALRPHERFPHAGAFASALEAAREAPRRPSRLPLLWLISSVLGLLGLLGAAWALSPAPQAPEGTPAPSTPERAALEEQRVAHAEAARVALEALAGGESPQIARALRAFAQVGSPPAPSAYAQLTRGVVVRALPLLDADPPATVELLEALAETGLQLQDRKPGALLVATAFTKATFGSIAPGDYQRLLIGAAKLDLPLSHDALSTLPKPPAKTTGSDRIWLRYLHLRRRAARGRHIRRELLELLRADPPRLALGPCGWADSVAAVVPHNASEEIEALLAAADARDPKNPNVASARALVLFERGRRAESLAAARSAIEFHSQRTDPRLDFVTLRRLLVNLLKLEISCDERAAARETYARLKPLSGEQAEDFAERHPWLVEGR